MTPEQASLAKQMYWATVHQIAKDAFKSTLNEGDQDSDVEMYIAEEVANCDFLDDDAGVMIALRETKSDPFNTENWGHARTALGVVYMLARTAMELDALDEVERLQGNV